MQSSNNTTFKRFIEIGFAFVLTLACALESAHAQAQPPFAKEINGFKSLDSAAFPASEQILLIGSSSFTLWKDVNQYFPGYKMLNRAFGGSTLADVIRYRYEVIFPYDPKQIIIYCGENDFAASDTVTVPMVIHRFRELFSYIRAKYPKVHVAYVSMKPSPSRRRLMEKYVAANKEIRDFLAAQKRTRYIDVYDAMLMPNGQPLPDIFKADSLHMNAQGYAIWQKQIAPHLKK